MERRNYDDPFLASIPLDRKLEIDAILRRGEAEIMSGKRDLDKEGMSVEEYKRRREEAWKRGEKGKAIHDAIQKKQSNKQSP